MVDFTIEVENETYAVRVDDPGVSVHVLESDPATIVTVEGPSGPPGPPGDGTAIMGEAPSGIKDGVSTSFSITHSYRPLTLAVYRNGLREVRGVGFIEALPNSLVFSNPPLTTDDISVDYVVA